MKRMLIAAVAAFGLLGLVQANGPILGKVAGGGCNDCQTAAPAAPCGGMPGFGGCPECAARCERDKRFGLNPFFTRLMFWKKDNECGTCGVKGKLRGLFNNCGGCRGGCGDGFNPYPNGVPGTLVFPQHPYVRSPRDWYEK